MRKIAAMGLYAVYGEASMVPALRAQWLMMQLVAVYYLNFKPEAG
ncbi:MAG: hypothetical protein ACLU4P_09670 [Ruminococcus sp.]